ncbi:MAG TPA: hypothetical protein VM621_14860 [Luteibacter sp.]|uniref:hypothetical protein n=1 Tax=Luteibacter sp. TaxID=1886636 RepID=UPI002D06D6C3|nr:hypothetical protein [Luteibacter sp.]HVI56320.1 hypothetical protein [Luteibacter sp.]
MAKTLITWPHGSTDGEREAKRLQALYPAASNWVDGSSLAGVTSKDFSLLIVVGHREEIEAVDTLKALAACVTQLGIKWVVMANCNSAQTRTGGTLSDFNELWAPGQRLANDTGARVAATKRVLLFDEVGKGTAFKADATHGIVPTNPSGSDLWKEFTKQDDVDEITEGVSRL